MWGKSTLYVVELFSSPYISFLREPTQNCVEGIDLFGLKGENEMNDANEDFRSADSMAEQNQLDTQTMDVLVADLDDPNAPSGIPMSDVLVAREPELEFTPKPDRPKQVKAPALVYAGDTCFVEWWRGSWPSHFLLLECG